MRRRGATTTPTCRGDGSACVSSGDSIDSGKNASDGRRAEARAREESSSLCRNCGDAVEGSIDEISPNRTSLSLLVTRKEIRNCYLPKLSLAQYYSPRDKYVVP
jgi:hypothetical protein